MFKLENKRTGRRVSSLLRPVLVPLQLVNRENLPSITSLSPAIDRRLVIKAKYINDLTTTTTSLTLPSVITTTLSPPICTITTVEVPQINYVTETTSFISPVTLDELISSSPDTTAIKQFIPRKRNYLVEIRNPCLSGEPLKNINGTTILCNPGIELNGGCPADSWCHVGITHKSTVCCPKLEIEDRCEQPMLIGTGIEAKTRWYFNTKIKYCLPFIYKGLRGNANNFVTQSECMEMCASGHEEEINPCKYGEPAKGFDRKPLICSPSNSVACPKGFFCHIGVSRTKTACCERSGLVDPCSLPVDAGEEMCIYNVIIMMIISINVNSSYIMERKAMKIVSLLTKNANKNACVGWDLVCEISPKSFEHRSCSVDRRECGDKQWCHIGANIHSSLCCAGASTNPCELPVVEGEGNETITRWFADPNDRSCTQEKCDDPCGNGLMLLTSKRTPFFCSSTDICPRNYWCHIGAHMSSTVCCPESGTNPCKQPMIKGVGNSNLLRWYFDETLHKCFKFHYRGKEGNQNSFLTKDDCENACFAYQNPCSIGEPLLINDKPKDVVLKSFVHTHIIVILERMKHRITAVTKDAEDISGNYKLFPNGNPCDQLMNQGEGQSSLLRYYYDKNSHRCREFAYRGLKGNANNFLSEEDCEMICPVVRNPCEYGKPLTNNQNEPIICGGSESCPDNYYCHIGSSPETTNCCPGSNDACKLPLKVGKGTEQLQRWYYDHRQQMCHQFIYHGLHGNANNFITRESCQQNCKEINPCESGTPLIDETGRPIFVNQINQMIAQMITTVIKGQNSCKQMLSVGHGSEAIPRWFYDVSRKKCLKFIYSGLGGNENNFLSKQSCEKSCKGNEEYCPHGDPLMEASGKTLAKCGIDDACPVGFICNMNAKRNITACCQDPANFCLQPMDSGRQCKEFETRYGYDPELDDCVYYQYGGCGGTLNNFETLEKCTEICCKND
ncbi:Kunitz/Bovine pancreatic trypsin inhibitor domain protein [Dirofilaria immitis]|nr:Kunitz/Bovine pancreatic trypsin inhibitor domain protein [Dirofilaria immitis]